MSNKGFNLLVLFSLGFVLAGCGSLTTLATPATSTSGEPPQADVSSTLPADMPTAVPLWTSTPALAGGGANIALVNGTPITRQDYEQQLAQARTYYLMQPGVNARSEAGKQGLQRLQEQVLDWMIDQVLIEQIAGTRGITISKGQVEAEIVRMQGSDKSKFDSWLTANNLTLDSLRQQVRYDLLTMAVRDAVTTGLSHKAPQVHVRHILTSNEKAAQDALSRIKQGEELAALARQVSEDEQTRDHGGDLGFLPRGAMPPAFDEVAFALKPGQVSGVVRSDFGYHIIQVLEVDPDREVAADLWPMVQQNAFGSWLAQERAKAKIERK